MTEKSFINCSNGGVIRVYVKDGRILRTRPLVYDDDDPPTWKLDIDGRIFSPFRKACLSAYTITEGMRVYSEDRIKYPMMRVDFDPNGERHPENRGKSVYKRISWDEALDIVSGEIKRVQTQYGPEALMSEPSSHHNCGNVGYRTNTWHRFFNILGFTDVLDNPDSWEGWHWGATHTYGFFWRLGMPEPYDMLEDALKNTDLIVYWGNDADSTHGIYGGSEASVWRLWLKELGKKMIFIDPYCNYTAVVMGDKWIAPRPGTDAAMGLAIAYIWIKDDTYDKKFIENRTIGFEEFRKYVLGQDDGIPKTPQWAAEKCAVPARTIISLAREWASKRTMLSAGARGGESGACRQAYATEWARIMVLLQAMQGMGKPGVNIWGTTSGAPINTSLEFPGYAPWLVGKLAKKPAVNRVKQRLYRLMVPDAILNPPISWIGEGFCGKTLEQQFTPYTYPLPGCSEVKMFYRYGGSFISTMIDTTKWIRMYQSPKLEFVVNQDIWWSPETKFADIILPACTNLERNDVSMWDNGGGYALHGYSGTNHSVIVYQQKCVEPLYESKSDYGIFTELAKRLGIEDEYTEGNTEEDWIEKMFNASDLQKYISFEEFKTKGYYVIPVPEDYKSTPALRWFNEGRECDTPDFFNPKRNTEKAKELGTFSGKIEFVSQSLQQYFPDDDERPPMPRYIPSWEGHESKLAEKYPLQMIAPHPRFSFHTHHDTHTPWICEIPANRIYKDGYYWHVTRVHPEDAGARGINDGDIIKIYNDRATVLGIAQVTERVKPGVIHSYEASSKYEPLVPGDPASPDMGGCVNMLTSSRLMSKNTPGMAPNSCLVDVAKWEL
ncbi:molybdopterin-dependent oxidoreductase [Chloroflexota bacterium]